jgi:uncharacterized protein with PQ loop repeat
MDTTQILAAMVGVIGVAMGISPLLQVRRMLQRRSSADVSLAQLSVVVLGTVLWTTYGLAISNLSVIFSNGVGVFTNTSTLLIALFLRRAAKAAEAPVAVPAAVVAPAAAPVARIPVPLAA